MLSSAVLLIQCTNRTGSQDTVNPNERVTADETRSPPSTADVNQASGVGQSATNPTEMGTGGAGTYQSSPSTSAGTTDYGTTPPSTTPGNDPNPTYNSDSYNRDSMRSPSSISGMEDKDPASAEGKKKGKGRPDAGMDK